MPSKPLPGGLALLNFDPSATGPMMDLGKQDGLNVIKLGEGAMFDMLHSWGSDEGLR